MRIEETILTNLIYDVEFCRKIVPFIRDDYFLEKKEASIFKLVSTFFNEYNAVPTKDILYIEINNLSGLTDKEVPEYIEFVSSLNYEKPNAGWLNKATEDFCKSRAVHNAIRNAIKILDGRDSVLKPDAIPTLLADALAVSFDSNIGHDFFADAEARYADYHKIEDKLSFDIALLNVITGGGLSKKTLNIVMAATGGGKSLFMCHIAAAALLRSKNVLYITMEMSEIKIAERIDENLINLTQGELHSVSETIYRNRLNKIRDKTTGTLIIKEYPTSVAHAGHFRALLNELKLKKGFKPDLVVIDYINICASQRVKMGGNTNSYSYIKAIAEELRGLAVEHDVPILSATQVNRSGSSSSDPGLEDTSESFGLPATADLMLALISSEELDQRGQIMVKQLKNRYNDLNYFKRFVLGVDKARMRLFDVEQSAQEGVTDSGQTTNKPTESSFSGFNFDN